MLDKVGVRNMVWLESGYIAASFCIMGLLAAQLTGETRGPLVWFVFAAYILCVLFEQFNMVHSYMMRSIALDPSEVTRTLSVGLSVDHVMAILASPLLGQVWDAWGVQYVFYIAAASALFQLAAASMVKKGASAL